MSRARWGTIAVGFATCAAAAWAGVSQVEPPEPKWKDTIRVRYDIGAEGAALRAEDGDLFAVVTESTYDERQTRPIKLEKHGSAFESEIPVRQGVAYLSIAFVARGAYDDQADLAVLVRGSDGMYARGAYLAKADDIKQYRCDGDRCDYDDLYDKELELHPDSYAVYGERWSRDQMVKRAAFERIVREGIKKLPPRRADEPADLLRARLVAALALGPKEDAKGLVLELFRRFPRAKETWRGYIDVMKSSRAGNPGALSLEEIDPAMREAIRGAPDGELARMMVKMGGLNRNEPVETVETICRGWMEREPASVYPRLSLARVYDRHAIKPAEIVALVDEALSLMFSGESRLGGDVHGYDLEFELPEAYILRGNALLVLKRLPEAYAAARTAGSLARADDPEGQLLEGRIWEAAGVVSRAENAFAAALSRGSGEEAQDSLKRIFVARYGSDTGFEGYVRELQAAARSRGGATTLTLPDASVTTLEGKMIDLAKLRGKVVVLNFFSLGCAPCLSEIPDLNKLVEKFKGNDSVVFLAPAGDPGANLKAYDKRHPFRYQIVPGAGSLISHFGVEIWPTHIVIARDGTVAARITGAGERTRGALEKKIEELLR